jgi:hypothetical protein
MLRQDIKALRNAAPRDLRKFGLMVGGVFCALGLWFYLRHKPWWPWFVAPGIPLMVLGASFPRVLRSVYVGWMSFAMFLGAIVSVVLLTILFYFVVTPIGLVARLFGKDFLSQTLKPAAPSYWIVRDTSQPKSKHEHERQF